MLDEDGVGNGELRGARTAVSLGAFRERLSLRVVYCCPNKRAHRRRGWPSGSRHCSCLPIRTLQPSSRHPAPPAPLPVPMSVDLHPTMAQEQRMMSPTPGRRHCHRCIRGCRRRSSAPGITPSYSQMAANIESLGIFQVVEM